MTRSNPLTVTPFPRLLPENAGTPVRHPPPEATHAAPRECELLARVRDNGCLEPDLREQIERQLHSESEPLRLWYLLSCLDFAPPRSSDLEGVFSALCRLATAESVVLRFAAYRWLTGLHRLNLRYENRAKLVLREGLKQEKGRLRQRLEGLLRLC